MAALHVKFEMTPDEFLAHLTSAAYLVALKRGAPKGSFLDFQLELREALREVIRRDMFASEQCGLLTVCQEGDRMDPWSEGAERLYEDA